jgi:hypothetical protein
MNTPGSVVKLGHGVALISNEVKTASMTSDNRPLGDVMDDVMYCLIPTDCATLLDS